MMFITLLCTVLATRHYVEIVDDYELAEQRLNTATRLATAGTRVLISKQRIATEKNSRYEVSMLPYLELDESLARLECSGFVVVRSGFYDRDVRIIAAQAALTPTHVNDLVACLKFAQKTPMVAIIEIDLSDVTNEHVEALIKNIEREFPWARLRRN
jgi:hypothetical protein